jgi:hypothetical protein
MFCLAVLGDCRLLRFDVLIPSRLAFILRNVVDLIARATTNNCLVLPGARGHQAKSNR